MDHSKMNHGAMSAEGIAVNGLSGGVCLGDFNGDGITDIFATSYAFTHSAKLFIGDGKGNFTEQEAHLTGITGGLNCQAADYDNDGDLDVLVAARRLVWCGRSTSQLAAAQRRPGQLYRCHFCRWLR